MWQMVFVEADVEAAASAVDAVISVLERQPHAEQRAYMAEPWTVTVLRFRDVPWTLIWLGYGRSLRRDEKISQPIARAACEQLGCRAVAVDWCDTELHEPGSEVVKRKWDDALRHKDPDNATYGPETIHGWSRELGLFVPPIRDDSDSVITKYALRGVKPDDLERADLLVLRTYPALPDEEGSSDE